jgi:hypothetical protein
VSVVGGVRCGAVDRHWLAEWAGGSVGGPEPARVLYDEASVASFAKSGLWDITGPFVLPDPRLLGEALGAMVAITAIVYEPIPEPLGPGMLAFRTEQFERIAEIVVNGGWGNDD